MIGHGSLSNCLRVSLIRIVADALVKGLVLRDNLMNAENSGYTDGCSCGSCSAKQALAAALMMLLLIHFARQRFLGLGCEELLFEPLNRFTPVHTCLSLFRAR
jgi:hypothetical protein